MAVPTGGEVTIYDSANKQGEIRVAVGLDYPALTAEKSVTFDSALDPKDFFFTQRGGDPLVSGGDLLIRSKGGLPIEFVRTKESAGWFPDSLDFPFEQEFNVTFPQADPIYTPIITMGGVHQEGGDIQEPLQIQHRGSASSDGLGGDPSKTGNIQVYSDGGLAHEVASDGFDYQFIVQYDPQKAVNAFKWTVKVEGVARVETDDAAPPRYLNLGWPWGVLNNRKTGEAIPGLAGVQTVMQVHDLTSRQLGAQGYETRTYPVWTTANAGGTSIENAAEGERWPEDGETWAKVPVRQIVSCVVSRRRSAGKPRFSMVLKGKDQSGASAAENLFDGDRLEGRPINIDMRTTDRTTGSSAAWRRRIAGRITKVTTRTSGRGVEVVVEGVCRVTHALDTFVGAEFLGEGAAEVPADALERLDVVPNMDTVLERLVGIADRVAGDALGAADIDIRSPDVVPDYLSSLGHSLLPTFGAFCRQMGLEYFPVYATSGTGQYGQLRAHAWTLGSGVAGYTFRARGAVGTPNFREAEVTADIEQAVGQLSYRQNLPEVNGNTLDSLFDVPSPGKFPTFPYPVRARAMSDSFAFARDFQASALQNLTDKDGNTVTGGLASHRYRAENTRMRVLRLEGFGHVWWDPGDEIEVDSEGCGALPGETFVIDGGSDTYQGGRITTRIEAFTSDWYGALRRSA